MITLINIILVALNIFLSVSNIDSKNYKTSVFNGFAAGFCAAAVLAIVLE